MKLIKKIKELFGIEKEIQESIPEGKRYCHTCNQVKEESKARYRDPNGKRLCNSCYMKYYFQMKNKKYD